MSDSTPFVKLVCKLILHGHKKGFDNVDIIGKRMESWIIKNKEYMIYHRPVVEV